MEIPLPEGVGGEVPTESDVEPQETVETKSENQEIISTEQQQVVQDDVERNVSDIGGQQVVSEVQAGPSQEPVETQVTVQVHVQEHVQDSGMDSDDSWADRLIQGNVAPKVTVVEQRIWKKNRIFLVTATPISDNLFVTQLVDGTMTLKEQAELRAKGAEILITRDPDAMQAAHMNLDVEWLQHQIRMRDERQEGIPLRVSEQVPEAWKGRRKRLLEEEAEAAHQTPSAATGTSNVVVSEDLTIQQEEQESGDESSEQEESEITEPEEGEEGEQVSADSSAKKSQASPPP